MIIPYFNELELNPLADYYKVDIEFKGQSLQIDLNFEGESISEREIKGVTSFLENLALNIEKVEKYIKTDFETGDEVNEFLTFHVEELDEDEIDQLLVNADKNLSKKEQILSTLQLKRIGLYPDDENEFAIFDFVTDEEISQYLLVVKTDKDGELDHITMES